MVETILGEDVEPNPWPHGKTIKTADEAGKALVGCPNGYGIAYMLAQNQNVLGKKTITEVTIFAGKEYDNVMNLSITLRVDKYGEMSLLYHVENQKT